MRPNSSNIGGSTLNDPHARKAVRQRIQADSRNVSAQQKAQDSGIDYWLQQHHRSPISAPLPGLDATADLILANHLISNGLNNAEFADYRRNDAPTELEHATSRPKAKKTDEAIKPWDGQMVLNRNMQPLKSKKQKPRTDQQLRIRKMTKSAGGACSRHRRLKQFVS